MRKTKMKRSCLIGLTFIFSLLYPGTTGKIAGTVVDAVTGEPLIGCNIMIEGTDMGTATDSRGDYAILNIPPGFVNVKVMMIGYEPVTVTDVSISVDKTTRINFELNVQAITGAEVVVLAKSRVIKFDVTNTESRVTSKELEVMPVSDVQDVLKLQGGITTDAGGGIHIRGGRSSEIVYMVDGVSMTDVYDGGLSVNIENNNIQELQVISGTFNAEYGRAMSGIINMVTKDGGNEFEFGIKGYSGDHTTNDPIYRNLNDYDIFNDVNLEANMSGPILEGFLTFYSSGRYFRSEGWLGGIDTFTMYGDTVFTDMNGNGFRELAEEFVDTGNGTWDPGEPFEDLGNGVYDPGEPFWDMNGNGVWDPGEMFEDQGDGMWNPGEPFTDTDPNGQWDPGESLIDSNESGRNGVWDPGEPFTDLGNGVYDPGEPFIDLGNGYYDDGEPFTDLGNGVWDSFEEYWDQNGNGQYDPGEPFIDQGNGIWNPGEPYEDLGNGVWDPNEPFTDIGNGVYDPGEPFVDMGNGVWDDQEPLKKPKFRAMNWREKWSSQNKLTFRLSPRTKLRLNTVFSRERYQDYDHSRIMTQEGRNTNYSNGQFIGVSLSHSFSSKTFFDINVSQYKKKYKSYLFEDPYDRRYATPDSLYWAHIDGTIPEAVLEEYGENYGINYWPQYSFARWGVQMDRFFRETISEQFKIELTSQINKYNLVKMGFDYQAHRLELDSYALLDANQNDQIFTPEVPELWNVPDSLKKYLGIDLPKDIPSWVEFYHPNRSYYLEKPKELSAFIQDKIEYGDMIVNVGLRFDYFDPNSWIPVNKHEPYIFNPRNPRLDSLAMFGKYDELLNINWGDTSHYVVNIENQDTTWYTYADYGDFADQPDLKNQKGWFRKTKVKKQFSPRLGIAYPISDKGVIHFSYGYFFQIPQFELLYTNPGYKIPETSGKFGIYGNPDLEPQRTLSYELGLQQELTRDIKLEVTGYFRDVRDWVSTGIPVDLGGGASYFTYVNKDYSNVRGIIVTIDKRFGDYYSWNLDYTFQVAEGSNSDPGEEWGAISSGVNKEPTRYIIPLNWDQTHTLNASLFVSDGVYGGNLLMQFGSGYPYTPDPSYAQVSGQNISTVLQNNSRRKQPTLNFDLKLFRNLEFPGGRTGRVFLNIYNLFDRRNEVNIWADTGRANKTIGENQALALEAIHPEPLRPNTVSDYFNHPEWYTPPRNIQFGMELSW